jgi:outer membrane lipoprotein SlyB
MEIPMTEDQVDIDFTVLADESGIYTIVSHNETMISIPEGKLPYIENTWETYKAYQMNSDRQAMENAIRFAEYQRDTQRVVGTVNSAINGATSGAMTGFMSGSGGAGAAALAVGGAVASAITDLYAQDRAMELTRLQTSAEYELSMKRSIDQAQTSYNAAYGLIYIALNEIKSLKVCLTLPAFPNADYFDDWVANFGYPAEGVLSVAIDYGYYSGILLSTTSDQSGMYWDRMNETFERGFKFVTPR